MKTFLYTILRTLARAILLRHKPDIIGITGSVGKSSTKEAVFAVLKDEYRVRKSEKSFNNEIGLPLTILGSKTPGKSPLGWLACFIKGIFLATIGSPSYPKILILEMGADKRDDITYLLKIIPKELLKIGIITAISPAHLEAFKTIENVLDEKKKLLLGLAPSGWAIINNDDAQAEELKIDVKSKILTYGLNLSADVTAREVKFSEAGIIFKLSSSASAVPANLPSAIGVHQLYSALAAASVGVAYGLHLVHTSEKLKKLMPLPGRMRLLSGIKQTKIIDDTYNSSPLAAKAAITALSSLASFGAKWAVLGDMLELGKTAEEEHRGLGREIAKAGINYLVAVGELARDIARGARKVGLDKDHIFEFADTKSAGLFIQGRLKKGDLILIKGSQGARLEKITKELMAEPMRAKELLVRQDEQWLKKQT